MTPTVSVSVLFFAKAREIVGKSKTNVDLPSSPITGKELVSLLEAAFQDLKCLNRSYVLAVNEEYVEDGSTVTLNARDELAVIPPLSGG